MKRSALLPFALVAGLLLSGCGSRSSLTAGGTARGTECEPWSESTGKAGLVRQPVGPFAALDDGSVVLATADYVMTDIVKGTIVNYGHQARRIGPFGEIAWDSVGGLDMWTSGVARDAAGAVAVFGTVSSPAQQVPGVTCPESVCTFITKFTETRALAWSKVVSVGSGDDVKYWANGIAMTGDGRISVEGAFDNTIDFGCGPLTADAVEASGSASRYVAQLSPSGECLWSRAILGTPQTYLTADRIAVGDGGEVAVTVPLSTEAGAQTIDLGGGPVPFKTEKGPAFAIAKYAPNGDLVFAKVVTGELKYPTVGLVAPPVSVAVTGAGEVLLSAQYPGPLDLGGGPKGSPGIMRSFITKLGADGEELWTRDLADGFGGGDPAVLPSGDFLIASRGAPGLQILGKPIPEREVYVATYDADGEPLDVQMFPQLEVGDITGTSPTADGGLVLAGTFQNTLDFGQGPLERVGHWDTYVAKICR